jgi:hypothetical protein
MNLTTEITVTLKDSERTYKEKFLIYDRIMMSLDCPVLKACVEKAKQGFKGDPIDILVKATASYE